MKQTLIVLTTFALCMAFVFVAKHHHRRENSFKACTLGEVYRDIFSSLSEVLSPKTGVYVSLAAAAMFASFYPVLLMIMIAWLRPSSGAVFVLGGLVALAGAAANFLGMLISHLSFGFGASSSTADQTAFIVLIPLFQATFALASILIGASATCASLANRWVAS